MDNRKSTDFSELLNSNDLCVWSIVTSVLALGVMLCLLLFAKCTTPPDIRGFSIVTVFFMFSIVLGLTGLFAGALELLRSDGRAIALAGVIISLAFWLLFYFNIEWNSCFNVIILKDMF